MMTPTLASVSTEDYQALQQLCRDDGYTYIEDDLTICTSAPTDAPKLPLIIDAVQMLDCMVGNSPRIEEVSQRLVDAQLKTLDGDGENRAIERSKEDLNIIERQLISLCQTAVNENSSDVHVITSSTLTKFMMRVDGVRRFIDRFHDNTNARNQPAELGRSLINFVFSTLDNQDIKYNIPANGSFVLTLKVDGKDRDFEWRSAFIPLDDNGLKLTLRCVTPKKKALRLQDMDLPPAYLKTLISMVHKRQGAIVVTGPMGSGKSSLVYALLEEIDRVARNVHSLEDPVEFSQENVCKTLVRPAMETVKGNGIFMDYAFYCKETLRHDVDVSNVGEIRETSTANEFCRKAETGGLAMATLHTNSAMGVPQTFIQHLNIPAAIVGAPDLMALFVHQKLVRTVCPHCAYPYSEHSEAHVINAYKAHDQSEKLEVKVKQLAQLCTEAELSHVKIINPNGCEKCDYSGEKGRASVMELIVLDDEDRKFIIKQDDHGWKEHLKRRSWPDIKAHTKSRIVRGQVDILSASEQVDNLITVEVSSIYQDMTGDLFNEQANH